MVTMGSITAFRGIFAGQGPQSLGTDHQVPSSFKRLLSRLGLTRKTAKSSVPEVPEVPQGAHLPDDSISHATLKGLRTFIRRYGRGAGHTTVGLESDTDPLDEYHNFQRDQGKTRQNQIFAMREWSTVSTKVPVTGSTKVGGWNHIVSSLLT